MYSWRQCSIFCRASSSDRNQLTLRHSSRKLPLNDSISALSVGFPDRLDLTSRLGTRSPGTFTCSTETQKVWAIGNWWGTDDPAKTISLPETSRTMATSCLNRKGGMAISPRMKCRPNFYLIPVFFVKYLEWYCAELPC